MKPETKSVEECLQEAAEYERLADLTRLESTRRILALSASYCRKLAVRVAERDRTHCINLLQVSPARLTAMPSEIDPVPRDLELSRSQSESVVLAQR
jgi:hypothetical protein